MCTDSVLARIHERLHPRVLRHVRFKAILNGHEDSPVNGYLCSSVDTELHALIHHGSIQQDVSARMPRAFRTALCVFKRLQFCLQWRTKDVLCFHQFDVRQKWAETLHRLIHCDKNRSSWVSQVFWRLQKLNYRSSNHSKRLLRAYAPAEVLKTSVPLIEHWK